MILVMMTKRGRKVGRSEKVRSIGGGEGSGRDGPEGCDGDNDDDDDNDKVEEAENDEMSIRKAEGRRRRRKNRKKRTVSGKDESDGFVFIHVVLFVAEEIDSW